MAVRFGRLGFGCCAFSVDSTKKGRRLETLPDGSGMWSSRVRRSQTKRQGISLSFSPLGRPFLDLFASFPLNHSTY